MNLFDILGPVMVGPSSSHTAGAARIGLTARRLLGEGTPRKAKITLYGSFAATGRGHGTDRALIAGLLGYKPDDERLSDSFRWAEGHGLEFTFENSKLSAEHPNTARLELEGKSGHTLCVEACSLGGGRIMVMELNGLRVKFAGDFPTLIVQNQDRPGMVGIVTSRLAQDGVNIATLQVYRDHPGGNAVMIIETDKTITREILDHLKETSGIDGVTAIEGER